MNSSVVEDDNDLQGSFSDDRIVKIVNEDGRESVEV